MLHRINLGDKRHWCVAVRASGCLVFLNPVWLTTKLGALSVMLVMRIVGWIRSFTSFESGESHSEFGKYFHKVGVFGLVLPFQLCAQKTFQSSGIYFLRATHDFFLLALDKSTDS